MYEYNKILVLIDNCILVIASGNTFKSRDREIMILVLKGLKQTIELMIADELALMGAEMEKDMKTNG